MVILVGVMLLLTTTIAFARAVNVAPVMVTYEMSHKNENYNDGYANTYGAWGYHALLWKHYKSGGLTYFPEEASNVPIEYVAVGDDQPIDANEDDACVFPDNPGGYWQSNVAGDPNFTEAAKELFVGAGIYLEKFGSPVYTNLRLFGLPSDPQVAIIQSVTFDADVEDLCSITWNSNFSIDERAEDCVAAFGDVFEVVSVELGYWAGNTLQTMVVTNPPNVSTNTDALVGFGGGGVAVYVADPIDDDDIQNPADPPMRKAIPQCGGQIEEAEEIISLPHR